MKKCIDFDVKNLKVLGDSKIIVTQVKDTIHCNSLHLKPYQKEVISLINNLFSFNIIAILRIKNKDVDSLSTIAPRLTPLEDYEASKLLVELLFTYLLPNNVSNWRAFEDDA